MLAFIGFGSLASLSFLSPAVPAPGSISLSRPMLVVMAVIPGGADRCTLTLVGVAVATDAAADRLAVAAARITERSRTQEEARPPDPDS